MKKRFNFILLLMGVVVLTISESCSDDYYDSILSGRVSELESRIEKLEILCKQMNTNISSLQTLVTALQKNDYITNILPITQADETIGYTISFKNSNPITIYHGKNGKDGNTPVLGVKLYTDGLYYWTLNGEWLKDDKGNMIRAQGIDGENGKNGEDGADGKDGQDGKNGEDGADGKDGQDGKDGEDGADGKDGLDGKDGENGTDGRDGITPQLKIEDGYWMISYDNGISWIQIGKAVGEDGKSMFNDVVITETKVTFILGNGVTFDIPIYPITELTVEVKEAGTLHTLLTSEQKREVLSLKVKGILNELDLKHINLLHNLEKLDLSEIDTILYSGSINPFSGELPNRTLRKILLPKNKREIRLRNLYALEEVIVNADSACVDMNHYNSGLPMFNSITYNEGIEIIPIECSLSDCLNIRLINFPSTTKRISHKTLISRIRSCNLIIICNAITPPIIGDWDTHYIYDLYGTKSKYSFDEPVNEWDSSDSYFEVIVKVPKESVDLYKQARCWRKLTILPIEE